MFAVGVAAAADVDDDDVVDWAFVVDVAAVVDYDGVVIAACVTHVYVYVGVCS